MTGHTLLAQRKNGHMSDTEKVIKARRPAFDRESGVQKAKALFHQHGYDAVGITELTKTLNINPPSLYAAYGSKAGLFERCLELYVEEGNLPADKILIQGRPLDEAVADLFATAARLYVRSPVQRGCLVAEGMRADDPQARELACRYGEAGIQFIRNYIQQYEPVRDRELTDYVVTTLRGFSAAAATGLSKARLMAVAQMAGKAFSTLLTPAQD